MNQQSPKISSLSPGDLPMKRKRGRPRKDENLSLGKKKLVTPEPDSIKKNKGNAGTSDGVKDVMVGQVVTGVIEGSFDAGYLLNVKVGETDTQLRGVVFLPGQFTPITAANDVAPHAKMYNRKEIPIPVLNPQTQLFNSVSPSVKSSKQPNQPKIYAPELSDQVPSSELQTAIPDAHGNQSASVVVPLAANLPKNDAGPSLEENEVQQQTLEPGLESQSTSIVAQLDHDKVVGCDEANLPKNDVGISFAGNEVQPQTLEPGLESQSASIVAQSDHDKVVGCDELLQECEASTLIKVPIVDEEATKESKAESASESVVEMVPGAEIVTKEPDIQDQAISLDPKLNELVHDEMKNPNFELNQTPVFAEPKPLSPKLINKPVDISTEDQAFPKKDTAQDTQLELAIETLSGTDTSLLNGSPASDPVDTTELVSHSTPHTSELAMVFEGEVVTPESKLAPEGSVLPEMIEPQLCSSGATINMECGIKDGIPSTQS
uniref:AT hook motif-containing protein n=1 Tax=Fagus sylvatica TaxID=28930 RepID=A0A2N9F113_FAGSY